MRSEGADLEIRYFQETIQPESAERMVLRIPEGAITINSSPDDLIRAEYELHGTSSLLSGWKSSIRRHDSILIMTNEAPKDVYTASVTVSIPQRIKDLEVHSMKGEIDIRDCEVDILAISELGAIHVHGAHNVEASSIQGAITLLNCASATVNTIDGPVRCTKLSGSLHVETQGGDVQASRVKGNVIALTSSGDISVLKPEGRIRLISHNGDIELELSDVFGGGEANSYSGDINLMLEQANVEFRAETLSGEISSPGTTISAGAGPRRCAYRIGLGTKRLHVKSVLGDIEVE
ncbi:MAG: DUF4097 family beta strand repeat-containing protein [Rectinemataceae bacterium]|nr:DUF4097 family beta strand repeat-containing protein [Rectinemataceae bacterium]